MAGSSWIVPKKRSSKEHQSGWNACIFRQTPFSFDPDPSKLPRVRSVVDEMRTFLLDVIDQTKGSVCCYKPNSAF